MSAPPMLSSEPLEILLTEEVERRGLDWDEIGRRLGYAGHCGLRKVFERGSLGIWKADRIAIALGLHPSEIWRDWFTMIKTTEDGDVNDE